MRRFGLAPSEFWAMTPIELIELMRGEPRGESGLSDVQRDQIIEDLKRRGELPDGRAA